VVNFTLHPLYAHGDETLYPLHELNNGEKIKLYCAETPTGIRVNFYVWLFK
jgi:hypothetical protein